MDWQERYLIGDTPWDKGGPAPSLVTLVVDYPQLFRSVRVLVPGCGVGYDAKFLAQRGLSVVGGDIAAMAISRAQEENPDMVDFRELDIFKIPKNLLKSFDLVWEHTCFCALRPDLRSEYVSAMWEVLKPGGLLLGVFFTNPDVGCSEGPPYKTNCEEVEEILSSHFMLEWVAEPKAYYPGREGREHVMLFRRRSLEAV